MAAWAFVAGVLKDNEVRLKRHYSLADAKGKDPLNAAERAKGGIRLTLRTIVVWVIALTQRSADA